MQVFDINQKPGAVRLIDQLADYVYFLNGSAGGGDTTIVVRPESGGDSVFLKPGQAYKFNDNERAARWSITNLKGEGDIIGQVLFSVGMFTDNRVSGSVEVIDGGKARTLAGQAFYSMVSSAPVAGQWGACQLWNPPDSGKNLILSAYGFQNDVATGIRIRGATTKLATVAEKPPSKKLGGPNGVAETYSAPNGTVTMTNYYPGATLAANSTFEKVLREPIVIPPASGLFVYTIALNVNLFAAFEFCEDAI